MWNTFKYTVLSLVREKNILIWALAFPLVLATIFNFMFANIDEANEFNPVPVAVVTDENFDKDDSFGDILESVSAEGDSQLLSPRYVTTIDGAKELLHGGEVEGYITLDEEGAPKYSVGVIGSQTSAEGINRTIVKNFLDVYSQNKEVLTGLIESNPSLLSDPDAIENLLSREDFTSEVLVTANDPSGTIRYFYSLLGFAALMSATIGVIAISSTLANTSALGARRSVGATSKIATLAATLLACWVLSFSCLAIAYFFIKYVFGIDFGGKDVACVLGLLIASLVSTALGSFIGALPRLGEGAKAGILTGTTCFLALFAGLYGEPAMMLADHISRIAPAAQLFNPSKQIADLFYSLYYYDTYTRYGEIVVVLLVTVAVLFAGAALLMRRQRHASL